MSGDNQDPEEESSSPAEGTSEGLPPRSGGTLAEYLVNDARIADEIDTLGFIPNLDAPSTKSLPTKNFGKGYRFQKRAGETKTPAQRRADQKKVRAQLDAEAGGRMEMPDGWSRKSVSVRTLKDAKELKPLQRYRGRFFRIGVTSDNKRIPYTASENKQAHYDEQKAAGMSHEDILESPDYKFWDHEPEDWYALDPMMHRNFHLNSIRAKQGDAAIHAEGVKHWTGMMSSGYGSDNAWQSTINWGS